MGRLPANASKSRVVEGAWLDGKVRESGFETSVRIALLGSAGRTVDNGVRMFEIDIYGTARRLVDEHGDAAPVHAAIRAAELFTEGDSEGYSAWKRIAEMTMDLLGTALATNTVH